MDPFLSTEHEAFRGTVRRFVRAEITPYAAERDEAETFPRELYRKAAAIGMLGPGFPEEYGGIGGDVFFRIVLSEELSQCGAGDICAGPVRQCLDRDFKIARHRGLPAAPFEHLRHRACAKHFGVLPVFCYFHQIPPQSEI